MNAQKIKALKRIKEEFNDISGNPISSIGVTVGLLDENNIFEWRATLKGPNDTSYDGGLFAIKIKFQYNSPETPPEICFQNPIYHVNVNPFRPKKDGDESLGHISLNILKYWKPDIQLKKF